MSWASCEFIVPTPLSEPWLTFLGMWLPVGTYPSSSSAAAVPSLATQPHEEQASARSATRARRDETATGMGLILLEGRKCDARLYQVQSGLSLMLQITAPAPAAASPAPSTTSPSAPPAVRWDRSCSA